MWMEVDSDEDERICIQENELDLSLLTTLPEKKHFVKLTDDERKLFQDNYHEYRYRILHTLGFGGMSWCYDFSDEEKRCEKCQKECIFLYCDQDGRYCNDCFTGNRQDPCITATFSLRVCDLCEMMSNSVFGEWVSCGETDLCPICLSTPEGKETRASFSTERKWTVENCYGSLFDWIPVYTNLEIEKKGEEDEKYIVEANSYYLLLNCNPKSERYREVAIWHFDDHARVGIFFFPSLAAIEDPEEFLHQNCRPTYYG